MFYVLNLKQEMLQNILFNKNTSFLPAIILLAFFNFVHIKNYQAFKLP